MRLREAEPPDSEEQPGLCLKLHFTREAVECTVVDMSKIVQWVSKLEQAGAVSTLRTRLAAGSRHGGKRALPNRTQRWANAAVEAEHHCTGVGLVHLECTTINLLQLVHPGVEREPASRLDVAKGSGAKMFKHWEAGVDVDQLIGKHVVTEAP